MSEILLNDGYRKISPIDGFLVPKKDLGEIPEIRSIKISKLVINEDYQRDLSKSSIEHIKNIANNWNWSNYKIITVSPTPLEGVYEIIDGQHTAIAAACIEASFGGIEELICAVNKNMSLREKAESFVGINKLKINLTKMTIYNAEIAAGDPVAVGVECCVSKYNINLLAFPPSKNIFKINDMIAIHTLLKICKNSGENRLDQILSICSRSNCAPISAALLRCLNICLPHDASEDIKNKMVEFLVVKNPNRFEEICRLGGGASVRVYESMADILAKSIGLENCRMGVIKKERKKKRRT